MAHSSTVLSQMLKMVPRHEFEKLANTVDGKVRSSALSRWSLRKGESVKGTEA
jgi:putative transposase